MTQLHQDNYANNKLNEFLKTSLQSVASAGAVLHEEQDNRARMDDLRDSSSVLNDVLALPPSLVSNSVQKIF